MRLQTAIQARGRSPLVKKLRSYWPIYLMMLPGLVFLVLMRYVPMYGLVMAFKKFTMTKGIFGSPFVGLANFEVFWGSSFFWSSFRNTLIINSFRLLVSFPASIILALLLNELYNQRFKKIVQTISFLPYFLSWVIVSMFTYSFLASDFGYVNVILRQLGYEGRDWYLMPHIWRGILVATNVWKNIGWGCIFYLAAIANINPELYEAAFIDGAGRWKRVLHITIPSLSSMFLIVLIINISFILVGDFEQVWAMTSQYSILKANTSVLSTAIYEIGLEKGFFGQAAAMGFFNSALMATILVGANYLAKVLTGNRQAGLF